MELRLPVPAPPKRGARENDPLREFVREATSTVVQLGGGQVKRAAHRREPPNPPEVDSIRFPGRRLLPSTNVLKTSPALGSAGASPSHFRLNQQAASTLWMLVKHVQASEPDAGFSGKTPSKMSFLSLDKHKKASKMALITNFRETFRPSRVITDKFARDQTPILGI